MKDKVLAYLGFAKKSGNLVSGGNTVAFNISKGRARLVIITEDISENGEKKIMREIRKRNARYVRYGCSEELSHAAGVSGRSVFAVLDENFSKTILNEIERGEA